MDAEDSVGAHGRQQATVRRWSVIELAYNWLFAVAGFVVVMTFLAQAFGVPRAIELARVGVSEQRDVARAWLATPTCRIYYGIATLEERARYDLAHHIDPENCRSANATISESERMQTVRAFLEQYSVCEAGKCREWLADASLNAWMYGLPAAAAAIVLLWLLSGRGGHPQQPVVYYMPPPPQQLHNSKPSTSLLPQHSHYD